MVKAGLRKQIKCRVSRGEVFGPWLNFEIPKDADLIVVSVNTGGGWRPVKMLLPGQLYVETLNEILDQHPDARWVAVHPVRSAECLEVWGRGW